MNNTVKNISTNKIYPFEGHPFKVQDNEEMNALIESIQEQGILSPLIVRPKENTEDEYEIVSGHRRFRAALKAGIKEVPALIVPLDRDSAAIAVVDSNLHRENLLPSEKAHAYKMKLEVLSHQGRTLSQVATKSDSAAEIGKASNESRDTVFRYIRLTNLIPPILDMVDEGRIAFTPAVELSYLPEYEQQLLHSEIEYTAATPSLSQAQRLRNFSKQGRLNRDVIFAVMSEEKANQKERLKIPVERVRRFFPKNYTTTQMEDEIIKMCEVRFRKRTDRDSR